MFYLPSGMAKGNGVRWEGLIDPEGVVHWLVSSMGLCCFLAACISQFLAASYAACCTVVRLVSATIGVSGVARYDSALYQEGVNKASV